MRGDCGGKFLLRGYDQPIALHSSGFGMSAQHDTDPSRSS